MTPYRVYRIVVACAVLHNICISLGEPEKEEKTRSRTTRWKGHQGLCHTNNNIHVEWDLQTLFKPF